MFPAALIISFLLSAPLEYTSPSPDRTLLPDTRCSSPNHGQDRSDLCQLPALLCHEIRGLKPKSAGFLLAKPVPLNQDPAQVPLLKPCASFLTGGNALSFAPGWITNQHCDLQTRAENGLRSG